jgi:drug/metabolite transporter (DMT)-like permease
MNPGALMLVLGSSCLHVVQHLAIKQARERTAFVWWMWLWSSFLCSPILLFYGWDDIDTGVWGILAISALFEALYFLAIARAYQSGPLSVMYPLARGTAPVFLLGWTVLLLAEEPTVAGIGGIGFIVTGVALLNLPRLGAWRSSLGVVATASARWALLAGLFISVYTFLDKVAIGRANAVVYTYLAMTLTVVWLTPGVIAVAGWRGLRREWQTSRWQSAVAGLAAMAAYALILSVMQSGTATSYVGAVREINVVFGTIAAVIILKEKVTPMRLLGSVLISAGVAIIAIWG